MHAQGVNIFLVYILSIFFVFAFFMFLYGPMGPDQRVASNPTNTLE